MSLEYIKKSKLRDIIKQHFYKTFSSIEAINWNDVSAEVNYEIYSNKACDSEFTRPRVGTGVFIFNSDLNILLGKRKNTRYGAGKWGLPGGKIELYENPVDCAIRETYEETGLTIHLDKTGGSQLGFGSYFDKKDEIHWITLFFHTYSESEPKIMEPDKCEEWKWFSIEEIVGREFLFENLGKTLNQHHFIEQIKKIREHYKQTLWIENTYKKRKGNKPKIIVLPLDQYL